MQRWVVTVIAIGIAAAGLLILHRFDDRPEILSSPRVREAALELSVSRPAQLVLDDASGELVILHGPVDLPRSVIGHQGSEPGHGAHASDGAVFPPVASVEVPADGFIHGFHADVVDREGRPLPAHLLHHVNIIDPDRRELFAPISLRVAAAGPETGYKGVPPLLFGSPLRKGQQLVIHTMLHNGTSQSYEGVVVRFHFRFQSATAVGPLVSAYPFWMDVMMPAGDKTFDLPPGLSSHSYEATPSVAARILALSGHMHEYATRLRFEDVTTHEMIWEAEPVKDDAGRLLGVPTGNLFLHGGTRVTPSHTYRLTVDYDNPTGETIPHGGMGSIGGIVAPADPQGWPNVDPASQLYRLDRRHYLRELMGTLEELRAAESQER